MISRIHLTPEQVGGLSKLDLFRGRWSADPGLSSDRLAQIEAAVRIQSTASSARLAGFRVTDDDVAALLSGDAVPLRDSIEIVGYGAALTAPVPGRDRLIGIEDLRELHSMLLGRSDQSGWRTEPLHCEGFDAEGRATGIIFPVLPPRLVESKTEELLTWFEFEMRSGEQHPIPVIGVFLLHFFAASPFVRGNGRMLRLLAGHLLRRAGYSYLPYASFEREIEEQRESYQKHLLHAETRLWTEDADPGPWLEFFLEILEHHRQRVECKIALERDARAYPPLQRRILDTVREHGDVDAALLLKATGANRNTLKDNLRRLVMRGVLEKTGQRRGTRYRMAVGEPARAGADGGIER